MAKAKKGETLARIKAHLEKNPEATAKEIAEALKIPIGRVYNHLTTARHSVVGITTEFLGVSLDIPDAGITLKVRDTKGLISTMIISRQGIKIGRANAKNVENRKQVGWDKLEAITEFL